MSATQLVALLGGTGAAARFFGVKPPSVSEWLARDVVPYQRLLLNAAKLERETAGAFDRKAQFPDEWREQWPELADAEVSAPAALGGA